MRASSFSNAKIIDLLNHYFVPVHMGNQIAAREDKTAAERIYRAALEAKFDAGTVCAYLVSPDGKPLATAPLNKPVAADPERLAELMEKVIGELKVARGEPLVEAKPHAAPVAGPDDLVVHVVARYLERHGDSFLPLDTKNVLGTKRGGNWGALPSEGWVILNKADGAKLLPSGDVSVNSSWEPDQAVMAKVLNHFYPPTENTDLKKNRIDEQPLKATVESVKNGVVRARLEGRFKMKHPFYHKDDGNFVEAALIGYLEFDPGTRAIRSLQLVTDEAKYGGESNTLPFGAAARSMKRSNANSEPHR